MKPPKSRALNTMAVDDKAEWLGSLGVSNFHNAYYEYRDVGRCVGDGGKLLVVGPGQGLDVAVFRSRGFEVTTYDIDEEFHPDHLGSVHDMSCFGDASFDVVIASHVLEHMAFSLLDAALREIARVGRHALVYLPYAGRHVDLSFTALQGWREHHVRLNVPPFWRRPSEDAPRFAGGNHFWEVGMWGCSRRTIRTHLERHFSVLDEYQNPHWLVSMNYVLRSRSAAR